MDAELSELEKQIAEFASFCESEDCFRATDADFPAFGKAYRDLRSEEASLANSIAMERYRALTWLCGNTKNWDEIPATMLGRIPE